MKLWSKYQQEKYNRKTLIEKDKDGKDIGFILYRVYDDKSCLIDTLFVTKEERNKGIGKKLEQLVISEEKVTDLYCEIDLLANNAEMAFNQMLNQGYKVFNLRENVAILRREL